MTSSGANLVNFNWLAASNIGTGIDGAYCLRVTTNDQYSDQISPATTTVNVDTLAPTPPGSLTSNKAGNYYIILNTEPQPRKAILKNTRSTINNSTVRSDRG